MKKLLFLFVLVFGFFVANFAMAQIPACSSYDTGDGTGLAREIPDDDVAWNILYLQGSTILGCPFYTFTQYAPFVPTTSGHHCCMTPSLAGQLASQVGQSLPSPASYTGTSGLPGGSGSSTPLSFSQRCAAQPQSVERTIADNCPLYYDESFRSTTHLCCVFNQSSVPAGTAGAISESQCLAKGAGATCGGISALPGDGCSNEDQPSGTCSGTGFMGADETCCVPFESICTTQNPGARVAYRYGCFSFEKSVAQHNNYQCCRNKTPEELAAESAAEAEAIAEAEANGGGTSTTPVPGGGTQTACPTTCIDINTTCPTGTSAAARVCPSSNLKCCMSESASGPAPTAPWGGVGNTPGVPQVAEMVTIISSNPLKYDKVEGVLGSIMGGLKGIVVTLAILMIVIGGIMYILSLGNADNMKRAKNVILAALVGLAIVIAAPVFLKEISILLQWNDAPEIAGGTELTLTQIAQNILNFLLAIIGTLAIIMLIISGIMYLTSAGNENRMKQAKGIFVASLIGIAVAMASMVLVSAIARFFD